MTVRELVLDGGVRKSARLSRCGRYRFTLVRVWDERPLLIVIGFNPSRADAERNDPTISTLMKRASRWGYGGIVMLNMIPLRSSTPGAAIDMVLTWAARGAKDEGEALGLNANVILHEIAISAGAVMFAWGALAVSVPIHAYHLIRIIETECAQRGLPIYCMGHTAGGHPIHPLARGKNRVPNNAPLKPWKVTNVPA